MPEVLKVHRWDCAEAGELNLWVDEIDKFSWQEADVRLRDVYIGSLELGMKRSTGVGSVLIA